MTWRTLAGVVMALVLVPAGRAQKVQLAEDLKAGDCFRIRLEMGLSGEVRFLQEGKTKAVKLKAHAGHAFPERILAVGKSGVAEKVARVYETARADITVGPDRSERVLRPQRRLIVAQRRNDQPLVYSLSGALTRPELELTAGHFDTLCLTGLLPGKEVAVGDTWKVPNAVAQALCHFEGLTEQALTCKLKETDGKTAFVSIKGTANGIELGALCKLTIRGSYTFDLTKRRLIHVGWTQNEERDQGPASPASTVETAITLLREPIKRPDSLSDAALASVPDGFDVPSRMTYLDHQDPKGRFDLLYGREWHIVGQTDEHLVMRLMERGDFVAQVTVTPWTPAEKGKHLSAEEFREAMDRMPGWRPEKLLQSGEVPTEKGNWAYRLAYVGTLGGVEVVQNFYLVANEDGRQMVLAFSMTPKQAERLGTRDLSLVGSLSFPKKK